MTVGSLATQPAKAIYLANRHPRLTRDEFRDRWLRHSGIGESLADPRLESSVSGLRYCLTVDPSDVLPSASNEHDGVALLSLRGAVVIPTFHAMLTQNDVAYADELRTFERPVEDVTLYAASELVVDGPETSTVVLELARRRPELDPVTYLRRDNDERDPRLQSRQPARRAS